MLSVEAHGSELVIATGNGIGGHQPGGGGLGRGRRPRCATSPCAPRRSMTCSSSSPAAHIEHTNIRGGLRHDARHRNRGACLDRDEPIRARPAGFVHDLTSIAGRALRAVPRDLAAVIPPVFISLFFFVVNIGHAQTSSRPGIPGVRTTRHSRWPPRSFSVSPAYPAHTALVARHPDRYSIGCS